MIPFEEFKVLHLVFESPKYLIDKISLLPSYCVVTISCNIPALSIISCVLGASVFPLCHPVILCLAGRVE